MMKCLRQIVVIVCFVTAPPVIAQRADMDNPINFGKQWQSWSNGFRDQYLAGYVEGGSDSYLKGWARLPKEQREAFRLETATMYDPSLIRDVMTDLYKDPANALVRFGAMVLIARDKLSGKDVEPLLRHSREKDRAYPALPH